jgi:hypothetical protein
MTEDKENPFWVQTPEKISAQDAQSLFVDIFSEFPQVESPSHSFIVGPRGSGKSMMFRMMRPDCLMLRHGTALSELPFLGIYVPIKSTRITATDMERLDRHPGRYVFNEHLLCIYIAVAAFQELENATRELQLSPSLDLLRTWAKENFSARLVYCGVDEDKACEALTQNWGSASEMFRSLALHLDFVYWSQADTLLRSLAMNPERLGQYEGPLLSYHGFLYPVLKSLRQLPFIPSKPVYLLIDDADNLNRAQTEIVNSWISTRSTEGVCLKLSDQMGYKTKGTLGGRRIQSPHDYNEVDVSVLYTTQRDRYMERIERIVELRLRLAGISSAPREFFPEDMDQAKQLEQIADEIRTRWQAGQGSGARSRDDVARYTRPELIRRLEGNRSTYSYAGFEQLAHISSGVVRYFLEPAAMMYSKQRTTTPGMPVLNISHSIQDDVIKTFSNDFLDKELVSLRREAETMADDYNSLMNLIDVMGNSFFERLIDERMSERKVFSIALSDRPDDVVQRILDLGTKEGFFYRATLGAKRGAGRVPRYVLSRRLAPHFKLDPTSFAGYLFVTSAALRKGLDNPNYRLRETSKRDDEQLEFVIP